jgi:predicted dehydrogenase
MSKIKLALLGCGDVAQRDYLPEFHRIADGAELVAVCSRTPARVEQAMARYGIPQGFTDLRRMLAESDAEAVINLTPILAHDETNHAILAAGRHLYSEKPVATTAAAAGELGGLARRQGVVFVCAPCVRLFPQLHYVRSLLAREEIGPIFSARAYGHLGVPPWSGYTSDPTPYFAAGAGPAMDMGVYPLHALTTLLGPVRRVTAIVANAFDSFVVRDGPFAGKRVPVETDDNWQMILDFGNGCTASLAANNVVVDTRCPPLELHGLSGTIAFDPIYVEQPVEVMRKEQGWERVAPPFPGAAPGRSAGPDHILGVQHLVTCIRDGTPPENGIEQARHVLQIIEAAAESSRTGRLIELPQST